MRLLLVEDERKLAEPIVNLLKKHKYQVELAFDGKEGLAFAQEEIFDVILLDIMLPKLDGIEVLRRIRQKGIQTPIIMLSARTLVEDRVRGLDFGADDYLSKPFEEIELLARIRALLRRPEAFQENYTLSYLDLELDSHSTTLRKGDAVQKLTLKESLTLELLFKRSRLATSKDLIIERVWDLESDVDHKNVEYHISRLRNKMNLLNSRAEIQTVRGLGYFLREKEED